MPVLSRILSIVLRVAELAFAAVVAGIIGSYLNQSSDADSWPMARWIYTEVVAGVSLFFALIWLIPFSSGFFHWPFDIVISLAWFAAFGILVNALNYLPCGNVFYWANVTQDTMCGRWKAAEAFSFLSAIVWLASALLGMWFTFRVTETTADSYYYRRRRWGRSVV